MSSFLRSLSRLHGDDNGKKSTKAQVPSLNYPRSGFCFRPQTFYSIFSGLDKHGSPKSGARASPLSFFRICLGDSSLSCYDLLAHSSLLPSSCELREAQNDTQRGDERRSPLIDVPILTPACQPIFLLVRVTLFLSIGPH